MRERRVIAVEGIVQGVGFRPFVHRLAVANALAGFVRNDGGGVMIDIEGDDVRLDAFCHVLARRPPTLATLADIRVRTLPPAHVTGFRIAESDTVITDRTSTIPPDAATCDGCLAELTDPANRRYGYPFITCTDCGPRFTIVRETPFDRERTTMAAFTRCAPCEAEYHDPADRRFHAETTSCADCGPSLAVLVTEGATSALRGPQALDVASAALRRGHIVAIKALGGFHLACAARDPAAVARLRERKHRPVKPFAVMLRDVASAARLCELGPAERDALLSPARPIVLLQRREPHALPGVADETPMLGVMLPSTPLHHLLLAAGSDALVMTSGNVGGEPVVTDDETARRDLGGIADVTITHDRAIVARCDDSVVQRVAGAMRTVRRARGYVPAPFPLQNATRAPVVAFGGHLKNTVCVMAGATAHLSAHIGDLDGAATRTAVRTTAEMTLRLAGTRAMVVAHDLHPEYASTLLAHAFAREHGVARSVAVQHHHAHVAACVAEHGLDGPVIGVVFDGAGLGSDGAIWGGEFLLVDGAHFTRCGHLANVPLPGGDAAARRPWHSAVAHLSRLGLGSARFAELRPATVDAREWHAVHSLAARDGRVLRTSSVGRLFDAVASLLGACQVASFEGEAALRLQGLSDRRLESGYPITLSGDRCFSADPAGIMHAILDDLRRGRSRGAIAAAFHASLRDLVVAGCERVREESGRAAVVLSGGVFANALLADSVCSALLARRFEVHMPRLAPCNDGGLALGQAWVAARALEEDICA